MVRIGEIKNQALDWVGEGTTELRDGNENEPSQIINVWRHEPLFKIYSLLKTMKTWDQNEMARKGTDPRSRREEGVREQANSSRTSEMLQLTPLPEVSAEMLPRLHNTFARKRPCQLQNLFKLLILFISLPKTGKGEL